jgi:hypothetical protein
MILRNVAVDQSMLRNIPEDSRAAVRTSSRKRFSLQTLKRGKHFNTNEDFSVYVGLKLRIFIRKAFLYCSRTGIQQFIKNPSDRL